MTTRAIEAAYPLTPLQEGMLYHTIRDPAAGTFHVQCSAVVGGLLVTEHFVRAWELAAARHPVMRTFFTWEGRERPLQVVRAHAAIAVECLDWRDVPPEETEARWHELRRHDRARGFDLSAAPLMRLTLVRVAQRRHRLLWSMHHALMDGWSSLVVLDEVMRDYAALLAGDTPAERTAPSFDRFVGWLSGADHASDEAYWRRALSGFDAPVALPGGGVLRRSGERVRATHRFTEEESRRLQAVAASHRVTVNTLLMGAWAILLARHAGTADVLFGVTVSERPPAIERVERAAGLYLSTVPVRAPSQRGATVGSWLRALQLALSDARAHGAPGLAVIQRWSGLPAGTPLFESLVVFENFPLEAMRPFTGEAGDGDATGDRLVLSSAAMDVPNDVPLVLLALPGTRMVLDVVHDPAIVPTAVAAQLPAQLATLLAAFGGDPERPLDEVDLLGAEERVRLLDRWSGAQVAAPPAIDVLERFEWHAAATPDAVALRTEHGAVSYLDLDRHANRLGARLVGAGIGAGALVGVLAERSAEAIAAMLAALKVGVAYVPIDVTAPAARLARIVAKLDAVLAAPPLMHRLAGSVCVLPLDDASSLPEAPPETDGAATSAAYVVFTSGSTGEPKGVVVERGQLAASNAARDAYYPESPRGFLLLSPIAVDSSVAGIFWTLGSGGTLILPAPRAEQDVEALSRLVERDGATHTLLVPSLHRTLLEHADTRRLASLRCVIVAGEPCPADVVRLHHLHLPGVALHNEYGPSEATVWATAGALVPDAPVSIGHPIPGARVYLLDDSLRPVPTGSVGEICIGGACVARGYLGLADETARRFVADPCCAGGRIYRTGDRGRFLADGAIDFLGRADEQVKVRGFRVEPAEIERALGELVAVREAAVALQRAPLEPAALVAALSALDADDANRLLREVEVVA